MEQKKQTNEQIAMKVSVNTIIWNVILSAIKLIAGFFANSGAMISDAIHSMSDVFSTFIVIIGVKISGKDADSCHQYGHERMECVASIILAIILAVTGFGIGKSGVNKILLKDTAKIAVPGMLALIAAVVSIFIKEAMYWYTRNAAKKVNSGALMSDAWHHRSDALSSVGSLIGIACSRLGFPLGDPIASVIICVFIFKVSIDIFIDSIKKMTDESCDMETIDKIEKLVTSQTGVLKVDEIKTRKFGSKIYIDIEICADGKLSLQEAHLIAENVHNNIESEIDTVKHCMVHVNPA